MARPRPRPFAVLATAATFAAQLAAQHDTAADPSTQPMYVAPRSDEAQKQIAGFQLPPGWTCTLAAAEPDLCNVVAFAFDGTGTCYVAETFRINDGVPDTRNFMQWKDEDLACLTVADRVRKYDKHVAGKLAHYARHSERVRRLVDRDGDGVYDSATVFADGFAELADGVASGVLPVGGDLWFTNIPKLWRLRDSNGDGVADERTAVHDGYGVHSSLIGHDLHGLIVGPDRRLYFSIGDRGFHIQQGDRTLAYPHEGAVLRCELDGSHLEVVHRGLRNPQELAFDDFGDLFTGDNNSDGGDKARLVQILPGADSGWRIGYQWLSDRGTWNRDRLWEPRHPGQPTWIVPPIANFADGPSGFVYDVGSLPERFRGCFLLCDFRGGASYSGVHALRLLPSGAGHVLASSERLLWNALVTDVDFAPDGSVCVLDWVSGWNKTGKGRIYRLRHGGLQSSAQNHGAPANDAAAWLARDLAKESVDTLRTLLAHPDRRVRQEAQFALVDQAAKDPGVVAMLDTLAADRDQPRARRHAIQALGILGRRDVAAGKSLPKLLDDGDAEVRALTCRVLGDVHVDKGKARLIERLKDGHPRVVREAALAIARYGDEKPAAAADLLEVARQNDDHDAVLRHAVVFALATPGARDALVAGLGDASVAVRRACLLALARLGDGEIGKLLADPDADLRRDAAHVIYEFPVPAAMQALARLCYDDVSDGEAIDWRAINACRMLGQTEHGEALVHTATRRDQPIATRLEALAVLGEWMAPHGQCRVTGNWRPAVHENPHVVAQNYLSALPDLLADGPVAGAAARAAAQLGLKQAGPQLASLLGSTQSPPDARLDALEALAKLDAPELVPALAAIDGKAPTKLRQRAVSLLSKAAPEHAVPLLGSLLQNANVGEKQAALQALGDLRHPAAVAVLQQCFDRLDKGEFGAVLHLDLFEAAAKHDDAALRARLVKREQQDGQSGPLGAWLACREGGDSKAGRAVFHDLEATRCTRCHSLGGTGGNAGPMLDGIGKKLTRDQLLEALITPSARIAEGFGTVTLETKDGDTFVGVVTKEQNGKVTIVSASGESNDVPSADISKRTPMAASAMPPMGGALNRRQIRDLIEFLSKQQKG